MSIVRFGGYYAKTAAPRTAVGLQVQGRWNVRGNLRRTVAAQWQIPPPPLAPLHPTAVQGPTDPAALYVWVTWDRNDPAATSYEVYRNGTLLATVDVTGDIWDKCAYKDVSVLGGTRYSYTVKAKGVGGTSGTSRVGAVYVRTDADLGPVVNVDDQVGATDAAKINAAIAAAKANGGGVVKLGGTLTTPKSYSIDSETNQVLADKTRNVVLRGGGMDATFLEVTGGTTTNTSGTVAVLFRGDSVNLTALSTALIRVGDRDVGVSSTTGLAVGSRILLEKTYSGDALVVDSQAGALQDPCTGRDNTHAYDINEIEAISGTTVTFKYPFSQQFDPDTVWRRIAEPTLGTRLGGNGLERLTIRSGPTNTNFRTHIQPIWMTDFHMGEVRSLYPNRSHFEVGEDCYKVALVGCDFPDQGPESLTGTTQYGVSLWETANARVTACVFGTAGALKGRSHLYLAKSPRALARHCQFHDSKNYAFGEHGYGSRHWICENSYMSIPSGANACRFGNETFSFSGTGILRNLRFVNCPEDIVIWENSYGLRVLDCVSSGSTGDLIVAATWGNDLNVPADIDPANYGALRLVIRRYKATAANRGFDLGTDAPSERSPHFPYLGVKDVIVSECDLATAGAAINLRGGSTRTNRFQISKNAGTNDYRKPAFVTGDYWFGNADASPPSFGGFTDDFTTNPTRASGESIDNKWRWLPSHDVGITQDPLVSTAGAARISIFASADTERQGYCLRPEALADANVSALLRYLTTSDRRYGLAVRHRASAWNSDCYHMEVASQGTQRIKLVKRVNGVLTVLATSTAIDANGDGNLKVRLEVVGSTIRGRVWLATAAEPTTWDVTATDTSIPDPGLAGFYAWGPAAVAQGFDHDDFSLTGTTAGVSYGSATAVDWDKDFFDWQTYDTSLPTVLVGRAADSRWSLRSRTNVIPGTRWGLRANIASVRAMRWGTRARVLRSGGLTWSDRALLGRTGGLRWADRARLLRASRMDWRLYSRVLTMPGIRWSMRARIPLARTAQWNVRLLQPRTATTRWADRSLSARVSVTRWSARARVAAPVGLLWRIRYAVVYAPRFRWGIRTRISRDRVLHWGLRRVVPTQSRPQWGVRSLAVRAADPRWAVRLRVLRQRRLDWALRGRVPRVSELRWSMRRRIIESAPLQWAGRAFATKGATGRWNVRRLVVRPGALDWAIRNRQGGRSQVPWNIRGVRGRSATPRWAMRSGVAIARQLRFSVYRLLRFDRAVRWQIRLRVPSPPRSLQWSLRKRVGPDDDLGWAQRALVLVGSDLQWRVQGAYRQASLFWQLRSLASEHPNLRWGMRHRALQRVGTPWVVRDLVPVRADARWRTRILRRRDVDLRYRLRELAEQVEAIDWGVRVYTSGDVTVPWGLRELVDAERSLDWQILALVGRARETLWSVRDIVGLDYDLHWRLRQIEQRLAELFWELRTTASRRSGIRWAVQGSLYIRYGTEILDLLDEATAIFVVAIPKVHTLLRILPSYEVDLQIVSPYHVLLTHKASYGAGVLR